MNSNHKQNKEWSGEFGKSYTDRNNLSLDEIEQLYTDQFGVGQRELNHQFLGNLPRDLSILEVGCNIGIKLNFLAEMGFTHLTGVDLQNYALNTAQARLPNAVLVQASALALPFANNSFDLVFTAGVLIHIHPERLATVLTEIYRVSRNFIWGMEYFAETYSEIFYRGHWNLLWKAPFAKHYQQQFSDLILVQEQYLPYKTNNVNVDSMYLLRKQL